MACSVALCEGSELLKNNDYCVTRFGPECLLLEIQNWNPANWNSFYFSWWQFRGEVEYLDHTAHGDVLPLMYTGEMLTRVRHVLWISLLARDESFFLKRDLQLHNLSHNLIQYLKNMWFICSIHVAVCIFSSRTNFRSSPLPSAPLISCPANQSADVWEGKAPLSSSSLLSSCHSFSPYLIPSEFLLSIPSSEILKRMSCCHVSRRPAGFISPSLPTQTCSPSWWNY